MSRIKSNNTTPEITVRKHLFRNGFRYRINVKTLPGKPDIVLKKYSSVIFINGCFWHGHENCPHYILPKTNTDFWLKKIMRTKERDASIKEKYSKSKWKVIIIWECELKSQKRASTLDALIETLKNSNVI